MTISSCTPEGRPNRCPVCRRRLRLSPSWPSADAPCPHCGSLVWFPTMSTPRATAGPATGSDFTLEDFRKQLAQLQKMGPVGDVLAGRPGTGDRITGGEDTERSLRRVRGMIDAMTKGERDSPDVLDDPRRRRIAAGAGVGPQDVERFLGQFQQVRVLMRQMAQMSVWPEGGA
jgi:signal recognition particle GTPase